MTRLLILMALLLAAIWSRWVLDLAPIDWQQCVGSLGRPEPLPRDIFYLLSRTTPTGLAISGFIGFLCVLPMLAIGAKIQTPATLVGCTILLIALLWAYPPDPAAFHNCDRTLVNPVSALVLPLATIACLILTALLAPILNRRMK